LCTYTPYLLSVVESKSRLVNIFVEEEISVELKKNSISELCDLRWWIAAECNRRVFWPTDDDKAEVTFVIFCRKEISVLCMYACSDSFS